jgi:hypothetical protein
MEEAWDQGTDTPMVAIDGTGTRPGEEAGDRAGNGSDNGEHIFKLKLKFKTLQ